ncbi:MAG TPA: PAS domain S-box protein, partial [Bacteroidia bacterium]|nr:PAS domain S-box protein [Bacteroidia bacterium]
NSTVRIISLEIVPLKINVDEPLLLILFTEQEQAEMVLSPKTGSKNYSLAKDRRIKKLEQELAAAHADALLIAQEQEAFTEELQSANEEVVSSNEELQTVNEELETSKEEIESANEELTTTNQELQTRNDMLNEAYGYSEAVFATIHEPMVVLDKNLRVKSANKTFYKFFNVKEADTEGVLLYDLGNKQWNIPPLRKLLEELLPKNSHFHDFEITHNFPFIGKKTMLLNARRIVQKMSHEELILLAISDISDKANARIQIEKSKYRFRNLVEQAIYPILILKGEDMKLEMANDPLFKIYNVGKEVLGKPILEILPELKDQQFMDELFDVLHHKTKHYGKEQPAYFIRANGIKEIVYFNYAYLPNIEEDDSVSGVIVFATDVTEQVRARQKIEESEETFRQLAELAPGKISSTDATGTVTFYSQNWAEYTGLSKEKLFKQGWLSLMHPDELSTHEKLWKESIATGHAYEMELRLRNRFGKYKWHLSRAKAVKDEHGNVLKWIGNLTEIQEQKEQREELQKAVGEKTNELQLANIALKGKNTELQNMNRELEAFTYVSSHDLQEPLRKIQTLAGRILDKESPHLSDHGKEYFLMMQSASKRMQTLIQDLLAFSRLNTIDRKFEKADLRLIIEEVITDFKDVLTEKKAVIKMMKICEANIIPFQFHQLLHNLIGNALKFSKPDLPPQITISSQLVQANKIKVENILPQKVYCHIHIADNGIGFENKFSKNIFEVFQRLHGKDEYEGTGIGLAIVKKIVDNHNGIITATSKPGKGAAFDIYIPA